MRRGQEGFTLIEILIVITVIAIVSAIAIPQFRNAKLAANESAAISNLRAILSGQILMTPRAAIDTDADGVGEYGYLAELAGLLPARVNAGGGPAAGAPGVNELDPSVLVSSLGMVQNGVVTRTGYVYRLWLPGAPVGGLTPAIPEDPGGGKLAAPFPAPDACEVHWIAYAWPLQRGRTGMRAYMINSMGQIMQYANNGATTYSGIAGGPAFDAALSAPGNMAAPPAVTALGADGNNWVLLR